MKAACLLTRRFFLPAKVILGIIKELPNENDLSFYPLHDFGYSSHPGCFYLFSSQDSATSVCSRKGGHSAGAVDSGSSAPDEWI